MPVAVVDSVTYDDIVATSEAVPDVSAHELLGLRA